jgi:hypothetical protein
MVGPGATSSKSRDKHPVLSFEESYDEYSPGLKKLLIEPEGIYSHTRTRTGVITPVDYKSLDEGTQSDDEHSAIAEPQSSNSYAENDAFA